MITVFQKLAENLPATITALAALVTAFGAVIPMWRQRKAIRELHEKTDVVKDQSDTLLSQTNGQLDSIRARNEALEELLRKTMTIIAARENKVPGFREGDMPQLSGDQHQQVEAVLRNLLVERRSSKRAGKEERKEEKKNGNEQ